jgi:hypothetical protein
MPNLMRISFSTQGWAAGLVILASQSATGS